MDWFGNWRLRSRACVRGWLALVGTPGVGLLADSAAVSVPLLFIGFARDLLGRTGAAGLLHHMSQLVRQQPSSLLGVRRNLPAPNTMLCPEV